jgi:hypothetical protein
MLTSKRPSKTAPEAIKTATTFIRFCAAIEVADLE